MIWIHLHFQHWLYHEREIEFLRSDRVLDLNNFSWWPLVFLDLFNRKPCATPTEHLSRKIMHTRVRSVLSKWPWKENRSNLLSKSPSHSLHESTSFNCILSNNLTSSKYPTLQREEAYSIKVLTCRVYSCWW